MIPFKPLDPRVTADHLSAIPYFLNEDNPRSAAAQFHEAYEHGGGWQPLSGWKMGPVGEIMYGSETYHPLAVATLHDKELIYFYRSAWVAIRQIDGSFEVSRMD